MKIMILIFILVFTLSLCAQQTYVPDDNFEQVLIDLGFDNPPLNDSVPTKNIDTVISLYVSHKNIYDLTGIKDFAALKKLWCFSNNLTSLDVSMNSNLILLSCSFNNLTNLDVSMNLDLKWFSCSWNNLTSLDVSMNSNLTEFNCSDNSLTSLNVQNGNNHNMVAEFDVRNNPQLYCIQVDDSLKSTSYYWWLKDQQAHYSENCEFTRIEETADEENGSISPNPATDYIDICCDFVMLNEVKHPVIKIYDVLGVCVLSTSSAATIQIVEGDKVKVDVSRLATGVYFVRISDKMLKFVKM